MFSLPDRIRRGLPLPLPIAACLQALTLFQRLGMWRRLRGRRTRVPARVISFGNLTAGGTGKTPAVIMRAAREVGEGRKVAVLTRGYGSTRTEEPFLAPGALAEALMPDAHARYRLIGDEATLLLRRVPEVLVVKARDRVAGAWAALQYGCDTLLLDDGFQAVALERDENILLVDAANPFGDGRLLPRGILREKPSAAARATEIILTRCDQSTELEALEAELRRLCPGVPIRRTRHTPTGLWRVSDGESLPLETLEGQEITAACAIGCPESFFATLEGLGARLRARHALPDHAELPPELLEGPGPVVVTEKDAVRLRSAPENVVALAVSLESL